MFHMLSQQSNSFFITSKRDFIVNGSVSHDDFNDTFDFAYDMTFGSEGEHRDHRSGGQIRRKPGEIFADTFQGKLAEFALFNYLKQNISNISPPDLREWQLNKWDSSDFIVGPYNIAVKSTKSFGNLLLLETKDWNEDAQYIPNIPFGHENSDFFVCVRIKSDCSQIMRYNRMLYSYTADKSILYNLLISNDWSCNLSGFITRDELRFIIQNKFILPQNSLLNGKTRMDAENYYVQMGDMHDISELFSFVKNSY